MKQRLFTILLLLIISYPLQSMEKDTTVRRVDPRRDPYASVIIHLENGSTLDNLNIIEEEGEDFFIKEEGYTNLRNPRAIALLLKDRLEKGKYGSTLIKKIIISHNRSTDVFPSKLREHIEGALGKWPVEIFPFSPIHSVKIRIQGRIKA